jgi:altronate hydrolase
MSAPILHLHELDNVGIALEELAPDRRWNGITVADTIPRGHKIALRSIAAGAAVRKYAHPIGYATEDIRPGQHVHTHNVEVGAIGLQASVAASAPDGTRLSPALTSAGVREELGTSPTFEGYVRGDGQVGTRNYVGIVTTVNCSVSVARAIARAVAPEAELFKPHVDGIVALGHGSGCALGSAGLGIKVLRRTLHGYLNHANFGAVLVVGLGCETNQITEFRAGADLQRVGFLEIQKAGGTAAAVREGSALVRQLLLKASTARRSCMPASRLTLGLQCGGSDGFSGVTANPALGVASDLLVAAGGTAILSETPEICGAEHLLLARTHDTQVRSALERKVAWWHAHAAAHGGTVDNNPSHGNRDGGLTTIFEKSLGAVAKSGHSPLVGVYEYAEPIRRRGFVFMDSPGYDPASATGQVASGANLLAFTTGRGSVFGGIPAPCLKIASNSAMFAHLEGDMDINAGTIADGSETIVAVGNRIFAALLAMASGRPSKSEELGIGEAEFVPWIPDAVM